MDAQTIWDHTTAQRRALAGHLATVTAEQWEADSMCAGWRVRDVAAHVIAAPQLDWGATLRLLPQARRGYNGMLLHDGKRRGSVPVGEILRQFEEWADVRRGPALVTRFEPLIDVLVHTQDILRPLAIAHAMPPEAAAVAADRARRLGILLGSRRIAGTVRMVANDVDWQRGSGPVVEAPMSELLMLCAGRPVPEDGLAGDGVPALRSLGRAIPQPAAGSGRA